MEERRYTVDEANELLPELSRSLVAIREARRVVLAGGERLKRTAPLNGGGAVGAGYWTALQSLRREVEAITDRGIILRDADGGLLDFPTDRDGREVFLCWRLGEERVGYWHGPDAGFSGRTPL